MPYAAESEADTVKSCAAELGYLDGEIAAAEDAGWRDFLLGLRVRLRAWFSEAWRRERKHCQ